MESIFELVTAVCATPSIHVTPMSETGPMNNIIDIITIEADNTRI